MQYGARRLVGRRLCRAVLGAAIALLCVREASASDRFNVCSITINSDDEIRLLEKRLPASQFRFTELTDYARTSTPNGDSSWFGRACASGVRCDVLVVSGHFGNTWAGNYGTTFAGRSGVTLSLDELEARRCDQSCPGILGNPLEVFLLGCKTLADTEGPALPSEDVAAFAKHQVTPAAAARILDEVRNGGEASSSRERMRFVFAGVPRIYGFTDVAPSGPRVAPYFDKYLKDVGDYAGHLGRLKAAATAGAQVRPNETLARALEPTCYTQTQGADPAGGEHARDAGACVLRDEERPVAARLEHVERLIDAPTFMTHLPAVDAFLRAHQRDVASDEPSLQRIRAHARARHAVLDLMSGLDTPVLRLELVRMARSLGWLSPEEALPAQKQIALRLLSPPVWGEGRDFICGMDGDVLAKIDIRAEDVPPEVYWDEFGIQALGCLQPADARIQERLAQALTDSRTWIARASAKALKRIKLRRG